MGSDEPSSGDAAGSSARASSRAAEEPRVVRSPLAALRAADGSDIGSLFGARSESSLPGQDGAPPPPPSL
jgi:hypothetical protein